MTDEMIAVHPQFITNDFGEKSVVLPLQEFHAMLSALEELDDIRRDDLIHAKQEATTDIPVWHQGIVRERIVGYQANPDQALDFEQAMDDIESKL